MSAREVVIKTVTDKRVADAIDKAMMNTKKKQDALEKAKKSVENKGFILK